MRNRILGLEYVHPGELHPHPQNWREHPNTQRAALREVLERIGVADVVLAYRSPETGKLTMIDGHLRRDILAEMPTVPVLILDLTDNEARALLAAHDPIATMAIRNDELYEQLLDEISDEETFTDIARMLDIDWGKEDPAIQEAFRQENRPVYEIVPVYDEGYDAVMVFCTSEQEWAQVATVLDLHLVRDRKGRVGTTHVLTAKELLTVWKASRWN
jgi:hypothetical protein